MEMTMHNNLVIATNLSQTSGHAKHPVAAITLDREGIIGDKHRGVGNRQVSILGQESLDRFNARKKTAIQPGEFGENLTIAGIDLRQALVLDRLQIGEVILEITQIGKKCYGDVCEIFRAVGQCAMPEGGAFARIIHGGQIKAGDPIIYLPKVMQILIITLSDRAVQGVYADLSGPTAKELIEKFLPTTKWPRFKIKNLLLPDDAEQLTMVLRNAIAANTDFIFTLGGTGIGPRDITPEVVMQLTTKIVPGIMENIRLKYGATKPAALLSRSIAAIANTTQIYVLPGSVRAVTEYLQEIFPVMEHAIYMLHAIDVHHS